MGNISFFSIKKNSKVSKEAKILGFCRVYNSTIDSFTYVGRGSNILNADIGKFCSISSNVNVGLGSHPIEMISTSPVFHTKKNVLNKSFACFKIPSEKKITIGNDVWIGMNVIVKNGIKIGDGAIIGAGSIVTKDVESFAIVAGIPAKFIRYRFDEDERTLIKNSKWWNWSEDKIKNNIEVFQSIKEFEKGSDKT